MDFGALEGNGNVSHLILLDRCGGWCCKKRHCHPHLKQWLLSIEMKTKVAQHVEREWLNEWESEWMSERESIYISCDLYATFLYYIAVNPIWRCHIYWVQTCFGRFLLLQLQPFQLTADLVDTKELVKSFGNVWDVLLPTNVTFVTLTLTLFNLGSRIMDRLVDFFDISIFKPYKKY